MKYKVVCLCAGLALAGLTACSAPAPESSEDQPKAETATAQSQEASSANETISFTDQAGNTVELDKTPERFVTTALPLPSVYAITGSPTDRLVGMHPGSLSAIESGVMGAMYPELTKIPTNFIDGENINIEELLKLKPEAVMYWADYTQQYEMMNHAGIKTIGVTTQGKGDALYTLQTWLEIMGKMFGTSGDTDKVINYGKEVSAEIQKKLESVPDDKKVKTLIIFNHNGKDMTTSGGTHYGQVWIESTGGINVARDIEGTPAISMEQVYEWNPDVIIVSSFTKYTAEDILENKIEGQDWSNVAAVKNKRVYKEPVGIYRWYPPSGDAPLMTQWMAQKQYPELFDYDMKQKVIEYYKQFYNYDLSDAQAEGILNSNPDAAKGADWQQGAQKK